MDISIEIWKSLIFVAHAEYFWQAMAAVTIISMVIGALIYNGDLTELKKAILTIFTYGGMVALTNMARIITSEAGVKRNLMNEGQAFNGTTTVIYVTLFYLVGISLGVWAHKQARK
jgi:hypothetical protein